MLGFVDLSLAPGLHAHTRTHTHTHTHTHTLVWADEPSTITFIELALDFEETSQRTLPTTPQAKYRGTALPLQERARVLRLALCTMQKVVTRGALHPAKVITRANSLVPLGGPQQSGLSRRPYFVSRQAMVEHIAKPSQYCEETWALRAHSRQNKARPYVYRHRRSPAEVEEARIQRALVGALNTGLVPSSSATAKGGGGAFAANFFPVIGQGKAPQAPYQTTRQRKLAAPLAPQACVAVPAPHTCTRALDLCNTHQRAPCITCKRLRKSGDVCCALGHHRPGYVDMLPLSVTCRQHGLPACARCTRMQREVLIAVPEGTTEYTRRCASGRPHRTRDQLSGCAPPAAPHAHTWSMRAPRTYQPHRPLQSDRDPSHHAPLPPPPRGHAR